MVDGLPGSGKSLWLTMCLFWRWKKGQKVLPNWNCYFSDNNDGVEKWIDFHEILGENGGEKGAVIGVDEAYKVFDCRRFMSLPIEFSEKLAEHRHDGIDLYTATQNFTDLDKRVRDKVAVWFHCKSVLRMPRQQNIKPAVQWIWIYEKHRFTKGERTVWKTVKIHRLWISRFWTKKLYDSYANLKLSPFLCRLKLKKGKPLLVIASREAINRGKVRGF